MGETGGVVTAAGLVFAFTMMSMAASDLRSIGQAGSTIGLGLLFDTLVVRSLMTPSIAALLGRWFWWPLKVRPRPASYMLRPFGPRRLVRSLLLGEDADAATINTRSRCVKIQRMHCTEVRQRMKILQSGLRDRRLVHNRKSI